MKHTKTFLKSIAYIICDSIDAGATLDEILIKMKAYYPQDKSLAALTSNHIISERKHQNFSADCKEYANLLLSIGKASDVREAALIDDAFDEDDYN